MNCKEKDIVLQCIMGRGERYYIAMYYGTRREIVR